MNDANTPSTPPAETDAKPTRRKGFNFWRWFWLTFLVVSLAYAWYCYYVPFKSDIAWTHDYPAARQQATQAGKPVVLFFTGEWCVPCRIMKRDVWADKEVVAAMDGAYIPVMVDSGDPEATEVFGRYQVGATPTTIIADSQGKVLEQVSGGVGKKEVLDLLARWRN